MALKMYLETNLNLAVNFEVSQFACWKATYSNDVVNQKCIAMSLIKNASTADTPTATVRMY